MEALALICVPQHFEVYLSTRGGPLFIYTDHNPLKFLGSPQCPNQRLMWWSLLLQSHCSDVQHIKGKDNIMADALSCAPVGKANV